jgi:cyclophilin family peptidyl-prolyl cis-trans isomerase
MLGSRVALWIGVFVGCLVSMGNLSIVWSFQVAQQQRSIDDINKELDKRFEEWREFLKEASQARVDYFAEERGQSIKNRERYEAAYRKAREHKDLLSELHVEKLNASPNPDEALRRIALSIAQDYFREERMHRCFELTDKLLRFEPDNPTLRILNGSSAISSNRFDEAQDFLFNWGQLEKDLSNETRALFENLAVLRESFAKESLIREAEAKADDLPRVLMSTTRGDIVVELFENEAPQTVANFIKLVETGYYDRDLNFHRVVPGFVAQGGEDLSGAPFYTIYDEFGGANDRPHFAYVLAMAKTESAHSAAAEFYITLRPLPGLNQKYAVFGRVLEGFDVVESLTHTHDRDDQPLTGVVPDKILAAKVLRKRDREYFPNIFMTFPRPSPRTQGEQPPDK